MRLTALQAARETAGLGALHPEVSDAAFFGEWIDARLLRAGSLDAYRARFESDPAGLVVIERFLREDVATRLMEFLASEAEYRRVYGVYDTDDTKHPHEVDEARFHATSDERRFYAYHELEGARRGIRFTPGLLTFLRFRSAFAGERFAAWFGVLAGRPVGEMVFYVHAMGSGDYLRLHDDDSHGRQLAFILYLTPGWDVAHGGRLVLVGADGERPVRPSFNTLVVFDVKAQAKHYVEPIQPTAGDRLRISIGGWITDPTTVDV